MKIVPTNTNASKTTGALIETIRAFLDQDGSHVVPGSIDTQGMTIVAGVYSYRLELSEPELLDWVDHTPQGDCYTRGLDFEDTYQTEL